MGKFTVIPSNTFPGLQMDAGVLLKTFNPETGDAPKDEDIICATTGGINPTCVPTYSDLGEDVDNCPTNIKYYCLIFHGVSRNDKANRKFERNVTFCYTCFLPCANIVR